MSERPGRRHRCRVLLLAQELLPAPYISPDGGWAWLSWVSEASTFVSTVKEKLEPTVRELECQALAVQCLAEIQALGGQVGFTHCSNFCLILLNYELSDEGRDNQDIPPVQKSKLLPV